MGHSWKWATLKFHFWDCIKLLLLIVITEFPTFTEQSEKLLKDALWSTRSFILLCTNFLHMAANAPPASRGPFHSLQCCSCSVLVYSAVNSHNTNTHYTFVMGNRASLVHLYLEECLWCKTRGKGKDKPEVFTKSIKAERKGEMSEQAAKTICCLHHKQGITSQWVAIRKIYRQGLSGQGLSCWKDQRLKRLFRGLLLLLLVPFPSQTNRHMRRCPSSALCVPRTQRVRYTFLILLLPNHQRPRRIFDRDWNSKPQFPCLSVYLDILKLRNRTRSLLLQSLYQASTAWTVKGPQTTASAGSCNSKVISTHKKLMTRTFVRLQHVVCSCWWHILDAKRCINRNHCANWLGAQG